LARSVSRPKRLNFLHYTTLPDVSQPHVEEILADVDPTGGEDICEPGVLARYGLLLRPRRVALSELPAVGVKTPVCYGVSGVGSP